MKKKRRDACLRSGPLNLFCDIQHDVKISRQPSINYKAEASTVQVRPAQL